MNKVNVIINIHILHASVYIVSAEKSKNNTSMIKRVAFTIVRYFQKIYRKLYRGLQEIQEDEEENRKAKWEDRGLGCQGWHSASIIPFLRLAHSY